jgi:3-hydroxyanthranilate 3,4-dioxygenase
MFYTISLFADRLRWYCENAAHAEPTIVREEIFHVTDLGTQLKPYIERWKEDEEYRRCSECGQVVA